MDSIKCQNHLTTGRFPNLPRGDVLIAISRDQSYTLPSQSLALSSKYFAGILVEENAFKITAKRAKEGDTIRFKLVLNRNDANDCKLYLQDRLMSGAEIVDDESADTRQHHAHLHHAIDNFLRAIHHESLQISQSDVFTCLEDCLRLVEVAEANGASHVVGKNIEVHLFSHNILIYEAIAGKPCKWIELACRLRSEHIFREAVVHIVGQWNKLTAAEIASLPLEVKDMCLRKHVALFQRKMAIEMRIAGHYPSKLERHGSGVAIGRSTYLADLYDWICLALFRQWFSQGIIEGRGCRAVDGGFRFYDQIARGGLYYLDHQAMASFHHYFEMSDKAMETIAVLMDELKDQMKHFVLPLLENNSHLDLSKNKMTYLLCCKTTQLDCPWVMAAPDPFEDRDEDETEDEDRDLVMNNKYQTHLGHKEDEGEGEDQGKNKDQE